jgi:hypothetical protein
MNNLGKDRSIIMVFNSSVNSKKSLELFALFLLHVGEPHHLAHIEKVPGTPTRIQALSSDYSTAKLHDSRSWDCPL